MAKPKGGSVGSVSHDLLVHLQKTCPLAHEAEQDGIVIRGNASLSGRDLSLFSNRLVFCLVFFPDAMIWANLAHISSSFEI